MVARFRSNIVLATSLGFFVGAYALVYGGRAEPTQPAADTAETPLADAETDKAAGPAARASAVRSIPGVCEASPEVDDARWNELYQAGFEATRVGDDARARVLLCQALHTVRTADASDWRFAETLDELGLVFFRLGDYQACATMQGLAVAEILLAQGPDSPDVGLYVGRLGHVYRQRGRGSEVGPLAHAPYRIFAESFVSWTPRMRARLQWLVAEYLKREDLAAATFLRNVLSKAPRSPF